MKIQLLGSPAVRLPNQLTPNFKTTKGEVLFYYLAVTQQPHARSRLATLFWGDMPEKNARVSLSKALSDLRDQVGDYVTIATQMVAFHASAPYELDVATFLATSMPTEALATLQARADLYRGDFLDGFYVRDAPDFEQWQRDERERLRTHAVQLLTTLATRYQDRGRLADAIDTLRRLLRVEPWREEAHYHLMTLLAQNGETHAALRQYELCRTALTEELAVEPGAVINQLYAQLRTNGKASGVRRSTVGQSIAAAGQPKPVHSLPQPPTLFVGREAEIKALVARLQEPACRLLTLVGPGGIGKTRLALAVARHLVDAASLTFPEGVFFVDLMPIDSAAGMVAAIAEAVGFHFYSSTPPQQQLLNYLKARKLLLLLDNFEHLCLESGLVAELLAAAPGLKVLVTSRDALPLQSAYLHPVQGLAYLPEQHSPLDNAVATDAVRLFAQCAQRHGATFTLSSNLDSVAQICRTVGGLPLALELAATWLKSLTCVQIAQELTKGGELLHANLLDIPARHRDMRIVFEQTWQRLTPSEAAVMSALAIFRGGFTLAAAEQVAQASIQTLAALVEKALIRLDETGRYQIHELLRQFAYDKLSVGKVQVNEVATAHARYFLTLAAQLQTNLTDRRQQAALTILQADIDNLRTAWFWALQQPNLPGIPDALDGLYMFFLFTCRYTEGKELFTTSQTLLHSAVDLTQTQLAVIDTQLATRAAVFAYHLGEYEQPNHHFRTLLAATPVTIPQRDIAIAHTVLGLIAGWQGRNAEAESYLQKSVVIYQAQGDYSSMAAVLHGMAEMYAHAAAYQKAVDSAQACLDIGIQIERDDLIGSANYTLGYAHKSLGRPKLALHHYQQGCIYTEKTGDRLGYALAVGGLGRELCQLGQKQWAQGFSLVQQSLTICRELGHFVHTVTRLFSMAQASIDGKRYIEAISFAQECVQIATASNFGRGISFGHNTLGEVYYEMDDFAMSRLHLQQAISKAIEFNYRGLNHCLIAYGLLLEKETIQLAATAAIQNRMDAVALVTAALRRPGWHAYLQKAKQLLRRQQALLSDRQFAAAQALANQQTLEELAIQILLLKRDKVAG